MSRIIIWTIVGILVVVVVIFTVTTRRQSKTMVGVLPVSGQAYEAFISRSEKDLIKLTEKCDAIKKQIPSPNPEQLTMLNDLDSKLNELSSVVASLKEKEDRKEREQAIVTIRDLKRDIRQLIRDLGGRLTETGGE